MRNLLLLAGASQLAIALSSLLLPRVLKWRDQLAALSPLTRHLFLTYAGYILGTNVAFALLTLTMPDRLLDGSPLARAVAGFITLYWGVRLVLQFAFFDRSGIPRGLFFRFAEAGFVTLFIYLTLVYGALVLR
jgi:hypothetical protein